MKSLAEQHYLRGIGLQNTGDFTGALAAFDAALAMAPHVAAVHYDRGNTLIMLRRLEQAVEAYGRCLALDFHHLPARYNRATALAQSQRWHEALTAFDAVVKAHPTIADAWNNRSGVLQAMGRHEEALESIAQALKLRPGDMSAVCNAATLLLLLNRFDEAQRAFASVLERDPGHGDALAGLAAAALRACDWEALEQLLPRLVWAVQAGSAIVPPLTLLALSDDPHLQKRCAQSNTARSLADTGLGGAGPAVLTTGPYHHDRIRIGYLSSDFRDHPVAAQMVGVLERHDRVRFEIIGLSTGRPDGGSHYQRVTQACDRFFDISGIGSHQAAALIRETEIDILIDLNGQTLGWRPAILKYRPAPVSATYLGYAGTTGADFVDYIIGDPYVTPFALEPAMSEKIVQLPDCFWPNDPMRPGPEAVSRAQAGLPPDLFVFCCFNSNHKIRPQIFDLWMRLLNAVPDSVLWLRDGGEAMNARFRHQARIRGIDDQRLYFAGRIGSFARHLGRQAQADLFLDTFPYNAHATASDALWAGLPVVTLRGQSFVSRVAAGLLANSGLEELVASTIQDYEAIALSLARDRGRLADVRQRLAGARKTSALFDLDKFVRELEAAYLEMHGRAQRGERPAMLSVGSV